MLHAIRRITRYLLFGLFESPDQKSRCLRNSFAVSSIAWRRQEGVNILLTCHQHPFTLVWCLCVYRRGLGPLWEKSEFRLFSLNSEKKVITQFNLVSCAFFLRILLQRLLQDLTLSEWRDLGRGLFERQPGLVFDALAMHQGRHGAPPPTGTQLPWCVCGNCKEMPTDLERRCCGQDPANCISRLPSLSLYCLDDGILRIQRNYREDITLLGRAREPGDDNRGVQIRCI